MAAYSDHKNILLMGIKTECFSSSHKKKLKDFLSLKKKEKVKIFLLNPNIEDSRELMKKLFPDEIVLMDRTDQVSRSFDFKKNGDYIVINPKDFSTLKRGSLFPAKCELDYKPVQTVHFQNDVYPSLKRTCIECHSGQGIINLFTNKETIQKWTPMMLKTMRLGKMPGGADLEYLDNADGVKPRDLKIISHWLRNGAPFEKSDEEFLIKSKKDIDDRLTIKLNNRTPDLILEADEEIIVPAIGPDFQKTYKFKKSIPNDVYLEEAYIESNLNVAHHHQLTASKTELSPKEEPDGFKYKYTEALPVETYINETKKRGFLFNYNSIVGVLRQKGFIWVSTPQAMPKIEKDSFLYLNVHYVSSGKEEKNRPKLQLYFKKVNDEKIKTLKKILLLPSRHDFLLARGQKNYKVTLKYILPKPVTFIKYIMHAHYRATSGRLTIKLPGENQPAYIASVPYFQFKLPAEVQPAKPIFLPKGTEILSEMIFDNSAENSANPDPHSEVKIGLSSINDEMSYSQMTYQEEE